MNIATDKESLLKGLSPLKTLTLDQIHQLHISDTSKFEDQVWNFNFHGEPVNLSFGTGKWESFCKCIAYSLLPDKPYYESITSIGSVKTRLGQVRYFIKALEDVHGIQPKDLPLLTCNQLITGYSHAARSNTKSHIRYFLYVTNLWLDLSTRGILPEEYSSTIDTAAFYEDLSSGIDDDDAIPWTPIPEEKLERLWGKARLWIERRSVDLIQISNLLNKRKPKQYSIKVSSDLGKTLLEHNFLAEDGVPWYEFKISQAGRPDKRQVLIADFTKDYFYRLRTYCAFVILLLTGMRILELSCLQKGCCKADPGFTDRFTLTFRRFKTASDSSTGEEDSIPVPEIVYKAITVLESLNHLTLESEFLFSSRNGKSQRLSRKAHYVSIKKYLDVHPHQARKTISWLLISRDEANVDLVRELLGHKSYKMTLRYILSNHDLMDATKNLFLNHYLSEFSDLMGSICKGVYSGQAGDKLADHIQKHPDFTLANLVDSTLEDFIKVTLESGSPLFLRRTPAGAYCLGQRSLSGTSTPCTKGRPPTSVFNPIITNCKYDECPHSILIEDCIPNLERDIAFTKKRLASNISDRRTEDKYRRSLFRKEEHLRNLQTQRPILDSQSDE